MKKIIFVAPKSDNAGGIAIWLQNIIQICTKNGIDFSIIDTMPKKMCPKKWDYWNRFFYPLCKIFKQKRLLKQTIQKEKSVLHIATSGSFGFFRDYFLLKEAKHKKCKTILHLHFGRIPDFISRKNNIEYFLFKSCLKYTDEVICIDKATQLSLKQNCINSKLLFNPVQIGQYSFNIKSKNFVFVGRVSEQKGAFELFDAFKAFSLNNEKWKLFLVGKVSKEFKVLFSTLKNAVIFGELSHKETLKIISESACLILPSHTEGMPYCVLEAMSFGIPCIATDVGCVREMIGDCGIVIEKENTLELIKSFLAITKNDYREELSKTTYNIANKCFSTEVLERQLKSIWLD